MLSLLAAALALQASPPALPTPTPPKKRCVRIEETGSYVRKQRVCRTEAEWRALERRDGAELDRLRDRTPINSHRPDGS
ncbi:hypothetical protein GGQ81_002059 [Sphingomonas desiccabilis]|nr:hypothetical protein [Sphingomonas desiccabilis]